MHKATGPEVLATLAVVALLGGLAFRVRTTPANASDPPPIDCRRAFAAGFVSASAVALAPDTWLGFAVLVVTAIISASWLAWSGRARRWTVASAAATAVGALTSRGLLAFLYDPLVGEVSLPAKLTHNVLMLLIVAILGSMAIRRATAGDGCGSG